MTWLPNNSYMRTQETAKLGVVESRAEVIRYVEAVVGNRMRRDLVEAFIDNAPLMFDYMQAHTEVRFEAADEPDYFPELDGASLHGRIFNPANYDAKKLGEWFWRMRPPLKTVMAFGGIMIDRADMIQLLQATKSPRAMFYTAKLLAKYGVERLRYPRGTKLTFGNALVAALLRSAVDAGVELRASTKALRLLRDEQRVRGVVVEHQGREVELTARRGVVLATGGFIHNDTLRRQLLDYPDQHQTMVIDENRGEGIEMGVGIGATFGPENWQNALGYQVTVMENPDGTRTKFLLILNERSKAGSVMVGPDGKRFANEAAPYNDLYHAQVSAGAVPAWLICGHDFLRRNGLGLLRPGPAWLRPLGRFLKSGYIKRANTIAELGAKIGVDAATLEQTIARMNDHARAGHDPDFGRGNSLYDRKIGDPFHKPHPNLGPIATAPFYALAVWPGSTGTLAGLATNGNAEVVDAQGHPIGGLYAIGLDMHSAFSGTFPSAGCSLGPAMTFGFTAARHMARQETAHEAA